MKPFAKLFNTALHKAAEQVVQMLIHTGGATREKACVIQVQINNSGSFTVSIHVILLETRR